MSLRKPMELEEADRDGLQLFNVDTMSGVAPGTRTRIFQRLQLDATEGDRRTWARLLWYDEPSSCMLHLQAEVNDRWDATPLLHLIEPLVDGRFDDKLQDAAAAAGWRVRSCGSCQHWRSVAVTNPDGLPAGHCSWLSPATGEPLREDTLALQSSLALSCEHWQHGSQSEAAASTAAQTVQPVASAGQAPPAPLPKAAEMRRPGLLGRIRQSAMRRQVPPTDRSALAARAVERSGVGAGTESCFACQGRLANLGALAVQTPEGDKQTFSIWRCRICYTYYLNDWVDRWERLDNLETEESYYRLAPAEAFELLAVVEQVVGGDHPAGRQQRGHERGHFMAFTLQRTPLSHQIKQGR